MWITALSLLINTDNSPRFITKILNRYMLEEYYNTLLKYLTQNMKILISMCLGHVSACSHLLGWYTITCFDDTWNAERFSMVEWLNEMEDSMIDGKKHKPGVMDNCIKPILNLTNDLSVLMSVNVSILKYFYRISYDSRKEIFIFEKLYGMRKPQKIISDKFYIGRYNFSFIYNCMWNNLFSRQYAIFC